MAVNDILSIAIQVVQGLINNGEEIYGIDEVRDTNKKIQNLHRLYFNVIHNKIVLHSMICPTNTSVSSGIYDARNTGFWIGLIEFSQKDIETLKKLIEKHEKEQKEQESKKQEDKTITIENKYFQDLPPLVKEAIKLFDEARKSFNQTNNAKKAKVGFTICKKCL